MTTAQLKRYFNTTPNFYRDHKKFEVDAETYADVCQCLFKHKIKLLKEDYPTLYNKDLNYIDVALGPNDSILFKNVELILKIASRNG